MMLIDEKNMKRRLYDEFYCKGRTYIFQGVRKENLQIYMRVRKGDHRADAGGL